MTCLHSEYNKCHIFFKREYFQFLGTDSTVLFIDVSFASTGYWKVQVAIFCSRNTSLILNCPRIQYWNYTKLNKETNTVAARGFWDFHTHHQKPRAVHIPDWKTNEPQNMSIIFMIVFLFSTHFHVLKMWACNHTSKQVCNRYCKWLNMLLYWTGTTAKSQSTVMLNLVLNSQRVQNCPFSIIKWAIQYFIVNTLCMFDYLISDYHILIKENESRKQLRC